MMRNLWIACVATSLAMPAPVLADTFAPLTLLPGKMPQLSQGRAQGPAARFSPAPMPNPDALAPAQQQDTAVSLAPSLTRTNAGKALGGDGFAPGSAYAGTLERRSRTAPGLGSTVAPSLNLKVPLVVSLR